MMTIASKPTPKGWPRITCSLTYEQAAAAIDWLCTAFGFEVQLRIDGEGGRIEHSELVLGGGLISLGDAKAEQRPWRKSPKALGGVNTQTLCVYVDDVDEHCERARKAGATIVQEPETHDYGDDYWADRSYECIDLEGHHWWFMHRIREKA
ncbi:MAG: VOC family protein [Kofleriaceae bacterium]